MAGAVALYFGVPATAVRAADDRALLAVDGSGSSGCEFHIWPAEKLGSVFYGWVHGGIVDGAQTGRAGYPQIPANPLPRSLQVKLLEEVPIDSFVAAARIKRVVHAEALNSAAVRGATGRLSDSTAPCYSELIVESVKFQQDPFSGSWLNMLFRYRRFGSGAAPTQLFGSFAKTKLTRFPPADEAARDAAEAELRYAFTANVAQFSGALVASASKPSKKK
ncbi:MAG: hypothetical protein V4618_18050 [Pseudomonadota bacterium]